MTGDDPDPRETPHHPRLRHTLNGHEEAEQKLLTSFLSGRLHHAWLIGGPRGVGKATLAYRMARFVLSQGDSAPMARGTPATLAVDPGNATARRMAARAEGGLLVIERALDTKTKRLKTETGVAQVRAANGFFSRTASGGGWRVCIVDAGDDLNRAAANALLKILEEPPPRTLFLLVCHRPGRLLATVRSRCLRLDLTPLSETEVRTVINDLGEDGSRVAALAGGSPGRAVQLAGSRAATLFTEFTAQSHAGPDTALRISEKLAARTEHDNYALFCELLLDWLMSSARRMALAGEVARAGRMSEVSARISHSIQRTDALNLDRGQTLLNAFSAIKSVQRAP